MRKKAVSSLKFSFFQQFITQIINYISVIILAALVEPAVQGFMTIATIPVGFIGALGSFGIREKIIKEKEINNYYKESLFGLIIIISLFMFLMSIILIIVIAFFYENNFNYNKLVTYGILISCVSPIAIFNNYFESFQTRELNFKTIGFLNIISMTVGIIISIFLAIFGFQYLALSLKIILPHFFNLVLYLLFFKPSFKYIWNPTMYKEFKTFSTFFTLNNIANFFVRNIDYIIIGKFFSAEVLGQYSIAYKILLFPMKNITSRIQHVAMPMLSKLDISSNDFKKKYSMIISLIAFIVFPIMAFVAITADIWVPLTFNKNYNLLIMMIKILSVVGTFQSLVSPVGVLYLLKESTKLMFRNSIINVIIITLVFLISSYYMDIYLVLLSYACSWLLLILPISTYWIYKEYQIKMVSFFKSMAPAFLSILISLVIIYCFEYYIPTSEFKIVQLTILFLILVLFYLLSYFIINNVWIYRFS